VGPTAGLDVAEKTKILPYRQECAANFFTRGSHQQTIFSFSFWHLKVGTGNMYECIDILILVYRLYHFIFSVPITKGSDNYVEINKGSRETLRDPCNTPLPAGNRNSDIQPVAQLL
jgi:hypothetical protein